MSRRKRDYLEGEDDGRTIADMSGVERPSMFGHLPSRSRNDRQKEQNETPQESQERPPWEEQPLTFRQQLFYALGTTAAALCIGLIYIVVLGIIIVLMVVCWT